MKTGDNEDSNQNSSDNIESQSNSHQTKNDETNKDATINANNTDDRNKDSNQDSPFTNKENINKQILEMYFSYGGDMIGLQESSRHSNDINLHIKTQGYSDGEEVEIELETSANEIIVTRAIIQNNQAIIKNIKIREER